MKSIKKLIKNVVVVMLVVAMSVGGVVGSGDVGVEAKTVKSKKVSLKKKKASSRKKKVSLNKKKVSIFIDHNVVIKVKNAGKKKVKWSVTNKKVISLGVFGSKVIVTGESRGTAYVIARVDGKKYKCKVVVKYSRKYDDSDFDTPSEEEKKINERVEEEKLDPYYNEQEYNDPRGYDTQKPLYADSNNLVFGFYIGLRNYIKTEGTGYDKVIPISSDKNIVTFTRVRGGYLLKALKVGNCKVDFLLNGEVVLSWNVEVEDKPITTP